MNKLKHYLCDKAQPYRWEWILLGISLLIPFLSFCYFDTKALIHYEINFMDSIMNGGIRNFYKFCYEQTLILRESGDYACAFATYDFPMYIVLGVWGIPLYFVEQLGVNVFDTFGGLVYGKAIFAVALVLVLLLIYKICVELRLSEKMARWGSFLMASSVLTYTCICVIGQSDILGIVFILLGLLAYIRKNNWQFVFWFMIAISFKQYALFIFIPLLLLVEKRILWIAFKSSIALAFTMLCNLPFKHDLLSMQEKARFADKMYNKLTKTKIPVLDGSVPLLIVIWGLICVYCYLRPRLEDEELRRHSIFIPLISMTSVFLFFDSFPYWFIHMAPYLVLVTVYNSKHAMRVLLFETVGLVCLCLGQFSQWWWCFEISNMQGMFLEMILGKISEIVNPIWLREFTDLCLIDSYKGILYTGYFVCMLAVIWLSRPSAMEQTQEDVVRPYAIARWLINAIVVYIPIFLYIGSILLRS